MDSLYAKIIVIVLLFVGEALSIYAEMLGARTFDGSNLFIHVFLKMFLIIALAGGFLIAGYMLGFSAFKNIWIVSAASITSILIIEPILAYTIFHQLPTKGAFIGLILGAIGFLATLIL
ncbi:MAG TPA: hypothetical protein VI612_02995 [Candidatus Nanoarchaeia archaeon]|nr:hypothetical protein [Candidatus Nanoarchaeia archaeon]